MPIATFDHDRRLAQARGSLSKHGLSALIVAAGADLRYLTGYDALPLERLTCLVVTATDQPLLVVPHLELPAAAAAVDSADGLEIWDYPDGVDPCRFIADALAGITTGTVAVTEQMWSAHLLRLQAALPGINWTPTAALLGPMRARKSAAEIIALAEAGAAIDAVHQQMGRWLRPGRTEREVAADIADAMRKAGHERVDFVIVAAGPHSASPHHQPANTTITSGDPIVVDIAGTMPSGYCSDCTRTYLLGQPPAGFLSYYEILRQAQRAAVAAVAPAVTAASIDAVARNMISDAGHGPSFVHRTGHGIGLDTHNSPTSTRATTTRSWRARCSAWNRESTSPACTAPASRTSSSAPTSVHNG